MLFDFILGLFILVVIIMIANWQLKENRKKMNALSKDPSFQLKVMEKHDQKMKKLQEELDEMSDEYK